MSTIKEEKVNCLLNNHHDVLQEIWGLEEDIKAIVRQNDPRTSVYFFRHSSKILQRGSASNIETLEGHFYIFTKKDGDDFPLLLDKHEGRIVASADGHLDSNTSEPGGEFAKELFDYKRFLNNVKDRLTGSEKSVHNRYLVEWSYRNKENDKEFTHRTSHFIASGLNEVYSKIQSCVPTNYEFQIRKAEIIPES